MTQIKCRCSKCGAMEVVVVEPSANPFGTKTAKLVCQKCGAEFPIDSGIRLINNKTTQTFPSASDLDVDDALSKRIKNKRTVD